MLVLSRRVGESVVIGDDVTITILEVRGDVVRVGIEAPRAVAVRRAELLAAAETSNREAASPSEASVASLTGALRERRSEPPVAPGDGVGDVPPEGPIEGSDAAGTDPHHT